MGALENAANTAYEMIDSNTDSIKESIVPLCHPVNSSRIKLVGSSIYVVADSRSFLITASHVARESPSDFLIPDTNDTFTNITTTRFSACEDKAIDIAVCELGAELKRFLPLKTSDFLNYRHAPKEMKLIAIGFPGSKTSSYGGQAKSILKKFVTDESSKGEYDRFGADRNKNIVIDFDRKNVISKGWVQKIFPLPNGMSGGGLFWLHRNGMVSPMRPKLVGVLTRWEPFLQRGMVATQAGIVAAILKKEYQVQEIPEYLIRGISIK